MFSLITESHIETLRSMLDSGDTQMQHTQFEKLLTTIHADVPEKKRGSYGKYTIAKRLGVEIVKQMKACKVPVSTTGVALFENEDADSFVRSLGVQLVAVDAKETGNLDVVLPLFERAAADEDWIVRECSQGFIKALIKKYPEKLREWYLKMVHSESKNIRRFVSESLRPVTENKWMHKDPDYPLSIIKHLFTESEEYPRSSVGNNLSDWFRVNSEVAWPIVEELAQSSNKNSQWIAYRACRNIVKDEPVRVMTMLGVEEYKYKNRLFRLSDYKK